MGWLKISEEKLKAAENGVIPKEMRYVGFITSLVCIGLLCIAICLVAYGTHAQDWSVRIDAYAVGHTYCYLGEKSLASDGVDGFDVPHPPFFPPGRAFIFLSEDGFPAPYNYLLYEYKHYPHTKIVFNLTSFYYPSGSGGHSVLLSWDPLSFVSSEYSSVTLKYGAQSVNMLVEGSFKFYSGAWQMNHLYVVCNGGRNG